MTIELHWGLTPAPENAVAAWGARAILEKFELDILHDRQDFKGENLSEAAKKRFVNWINKKAVPKLKKHIVSHMWYNDSTEFFEFDDGIYHIKASCQGSCGYCYILCWQLAPVPLP